MNLLILNLCLFCIGTVGVSKTAEIVNSLRVFKDAADRGYKLKHATMVEINITDDNENVQLRKLARWVPIVNILRSYNDIIDYNNNTDVIFDALSSMDLIEEMTEKEKEIYKDKPTILNAILTPIMVILEIIMEVIIPYLMAKIIDVGIQNNDLNYIIIESHRK